MVCPSQSNRPLPLARHRRSPDTILIFIGSPLLVTFYCCTNTINVRSYVLRGNCLMLLPPGTQYELTRRNILQITIYKLIFSGKNFSHFHRILVSHDARGMGLAAWPWRLRTLTVYSDCPNILPTVISVP